MRILGEELRIKSEAEKVLSVESLTVRFVDRRGVTYAVNGVDFSVERGKTLGIVGESGCGKTVTALAIARLLGPTARVQGDIYLNGRAIAAMSEREMRAIRGAQMSIIFQEPMMSLDPSLSIGSQLIEGIRAHRRVSRSEARRQSCLLLERVGVQDAKAVLRRFPHEMSGGMGQRILIAMALAPGPGLLLADEPTTALDVSTQAEVLDLLAELSEDMGMAVVLITHDMGVVARMTEETVVMYGGCIVESGSTRDVLMAPAHPYTIGLLQSTPRLAGEDTRLIPIEGAPPTLRQQPVGCPFAPRCKFRTAVCSTAHPSLDPVLSGQVGTSEEMLGETSHRVACYHPRNGDGGGTTEVMEAANLAQPLEQSLKP